MLLCSWMDTASCGRTKIVRLFIIPTKRARERVLHKIFTMGVFGSLWLRPEQACVMQPHGIWLLAQAPKPGLSYAVRTL